MTHTPPDASRPTPLRLWPGVVLVILQWTLRFVVPEIFPGAFQVGIFGGVVGGGLAIIVWWLFFSRAPWMERLGALALIVVAMFIASRLIDDSIATAGMGAWFIIYSIPLLCLALVGWAVATQGLAAGPRRAVLVAVLVVVCGGWTLVRHDGVTGDFDADFSWRWARTAEERLLDDADAPVRPSSTGARPDSTALWPGFRGPARDGVVSGVRIVTDWSAAPPDELWRRAVGPGWSSVAVHGDRLYTQEQRGDDEVVTCYDATTGETIWRHRDAARFVESMGGAGPRGTPTIDGGHVVAFGATGILNVLDANDGSLVWSRNAAEDIGEETPYWGFSSSPLVVDDLVFVAVSGTLAAYDRASGESRWTGRDGGTSYSSPHLLTIAGEPQILLASAAGTASFAPEDGTLLWEHAWEGFQMVQPALTVNGDVLLGSETTGTRRIALTRGADGWTVEERWTSPRLNPNFNDFVVHRGHAFGFDGGRLACIDLADGARTWKGERYGNGQLVLLADQGVLLIVSEHGELALVTASGESFEELSRFPAIEGKTWNHPVLAGHLLIVRNAQEMAAFRLHTDSRTATTAN